MAFCFFISALLIYSIIESWFTEFDLFCVVLFDLKGICLFLCPSLLSATKTVPSDFHTLVVEALTPPSQLETDKDKQFFGARIGLYGGCIET